jgi:hypothetical protein
MVPNKAQQKKYDSATRDGLFMDGFHRNYSFFSAPIHSFRSDHSGSMLSDKTIVQ